MPSDTTLRVVTLGGVEVHIRAGSPDLKVAKSCLERGEFDPIKKLLPDLKYNFIIDAGGYIGTAAIALAKLYPSATIVTVEASSRNLDVLRRNISAFPQIRCLHAALVGAPRPIDLVDRGTGEWGFTTIAEPKDRPRTRFLETIPGITVEDILYANGKAGADIIKLDIEGGEIDVLNHSSSWLPKTRILVAELHERIAVGCEKAFDDATKGTKKIRIGIDKIAAIQSD